MWQYLRRSSSFIPDDVKEIISAPRDNAPTDSDFERNCYTRNLRDKLYSKSSKKHEPFQLHDHNKDGKLSADVVINICNMLEPNIKVIAENIPENYCQIQVLVTLHIDIKSHKRIKIGSFSHPWFNRLQEKCHPYSWIKQHRISPTRIYKYVVLLMRFFNENAFSNCSMQTRVLLNSWHYSETTCSSQLAVFWVLPDALSYIIYCLAKFKVD